MQTLYIAGRMHCGSTFFNVLLGAGEGAFPIGELVSLRRGRREPCSCGEALEDCAVWSAVEAEYRERTGRDFFADGKWIYDQGGILGFPSAWRATGQSEPWATYLRFQREMIAAIAEVTGATTAIDSSKEFTRALLVLKGDPGARVVHLIRSPVAIVGSYYWRQERGGRFYFNKRNYELRLLRFPALMLVAATWNVGILAGYLLQRAAPGLVLHVSYEALCNDPADELRRIGAFAGLDLSEAIAKVQEGAPISLRHSMAGNDEIKSEDGTFVFVPNAAGRRTMPWIYRVSAGILSAPGRAFRALAIDED